MVVKARSAFWQVKLDVSACNLLTSSTPAGCYRLELMALVSLTSFSQKPLHD